MKRASCHLMFIPLLAFLLVQCATTSELEQRSVYSFVIDGQRYEIIGFANPDDNGPGTNDLVRRENNRVLFWYRDQHQNGLLDKILIGDMPLEEANQIYHAGIEMALNAGKYKERPYKRRYLTTIGHFHYEIITFNIYSEDSYNLFIVHNTTTSKTSQIRDLGRNGTLDDPNLSEVDLLKFQPDYETILKKGMEAGKILFDGQKYFVREADAT